MRLNDCVLSDLAGRYDTPLYVTDGGRVRERYRKLSDAFEGARIYYSCKANTNTGILKILREEGSFVDAVSVGEVLACFRAGFPEERMMFTGTGVRDEELAFLAERSMIINIDSFSELKRLCALSKKPLDLSFRLNPGVGAGHSEKTITGTRNTKFGMDEDTLMSAARLAVECGHNVRALHCHIGSGILSGEPFIKAAEILEGVASRLDVPLEFLDVGGGFGVPYRDDEMELDVSSLAKALRSIVKEPLAIEPGRYIVADSTVLLTRVNTIKSNGGKSFAEVDAGFNTLIRPAMYGSYHRIRLVGDQEERGKRTYDIVGPLCESGDFLALDREMPELEEGDLLAIENAGAYGYSMSSNYNSRPRAAEILVENGRDRMTRRRESYDDLFSEEVI